MILETLIKNPKPQQQTNKSRSGSIQILIIFPGLLELDEVAEISYYLLEKMPTVVARGWCK